LQPGNAKEGDDTLSKRSKSTRGPIANNDKPSSPKKGKELKGDKNPASGKEQKSRKGKAKGDEEQAGSDDSDANSDLENAYLGKKSTKDDQPEEHRIDSDDEGDNVGPFVHESLQMSRRGSCHGPKTKAKKFVPEDETPELRDSRTIFVGNLSVEVAQKRVCFSPTLCSRSPCIRM
jgi:nucleolar protein 12